jgi:hypothetical protein
MEANNPSPFAGKWSGKWAGRTRKGDMNLEVKPDGTTIGTASDTESPYEAKTKGTLSLHGEWKYTFSYAQRGFVGEGTITLQPDDRLHIKFKEYEDGVPGAITEYGETTLKRER